VKMGFSRNGSIDQRCIWDMAFSIAASDNREFNISKYQAFPQQSPHNHRLYAFYVGAKLVVW